MTADDDKREQTKDEQAEINEEWLKAQFNLLSDMVATTIHVWIRHQRPERSAQEISAVISNVVCDQLVRFAYMAGADIRDQLHNIELLTISAVKELRRQHEQDDPPSTVVAPTTIN